MTLKDIAQRAGVSTATVSYVLNNTGNVSTETCERVMKIVNDLNYKPNRIAKSLRVNRTNTIGILVEDITVFHSPKIINGINEYADKNNYHIILSDLGLCDKINNKFDDVHLYKGNITKAMAILASARVDGIIYVGMHDRNVEGIIGMVDKPVVYTYCYTDNSLDVSVTYDNKNIAYEVTNYLIDMGHEKIAVISGLVSSTPSHQRLLGYQKALLDKNKPFNDYYIKAGNWEYDSGFNMGLALLNMTNPPTAIFAMNDLMALGAIEAAQSMGLKVPKDLSVIGFDNREFSQLYNPKLTTVGLPLKRMGYLAAEKIVTLINKNPVGENAIILPCTFIQRNSVKTK